MPESRTVQQLVSPVQEWKSMPIAGAIPAPEKGDQSGTRMHRYRAEMSDAGMRCRRHQLWRQSCLQIISLLECGCTSTPSRLANLRISAVNSDPDSVGFVNPDPKSKNGHKKCRSMYIFFEVLQTYPVAGKSFRNVKNFWEKTWTFFNLNFCKFLISKT